MEKYGLNELREKYLRFFETKGHLRLPSFSLIPQHDPSLLLVGEFRKSCTLRCVQLVCICTLRVQKTFFRKS